MRDKNRIILITNDDGIEAQGIKRLAEAAKKFGEVWVVAPDDQRSAVSHSITLRTYIDVYEREFPVEGVKAFAISGTPGDCVRLGVLNILPKKPDIVFSGINYGYNAGTDVQYSATVGAAMEAVFQGIPAVAFSEDFSDNNPVTDAYLDKIIEEVIDGDFMPDGIINVNFPGCELNEFRGIRRNCSCSHEAFYHDAYDCEELPDGGKRYNVNGTRFYLSEEDSDMRAIFDNCISIGFVRNIGR